MSDKTKLQSKVEAILKEKHLTKVGLASALGLPKQNVDRIFNSQKMPQMLIMAQYLGITLDELLDTNQIHKSCQIDGFLEIDGQIFRVKSIGDLQHIFEIVKNKNS